MSKLIDKLKSFDLLVLLYCILTGFYILLGANRLENIFSHLLIRVVFIAFIFLLTSIKKSNNKIIDFIRNFYPLLLLGFFYGETDYYNNILFEDLDSYLINLESFIFGSQLSIVFSELIPQRWFSEIMHFGYFSYYLFTLGIPLLFYIKKRIEFEKALFIIIFSFCTYYIVFALFPSIGPQFYFEPTQTMVPDGFLFDKIMHLIVKYGEAETGAFPSSHVGMTVVFLILIWKNFRNYFVVLLLPASLLILSTVYLKAHYAVDIFAGILSGFIFYAISLWAFNIINKQKE
jgi:membrane-associated phospholipid phosphatase